MTNIGIGQDKCIICYSACTRQHGVGAFARYNCIRCGAFALSDVAEETLQQLLMEVPSRRSLMSYAIRRTQQANEDRLRVIENEDLSSFWNVGRLPTPAEQAESLILWIGDNQEAPARFSRTTIPAISAYIGSAVSPSGDREGFDWLHNGLQKDGLYELWDDASGNVGFKLTLNGWSRYAALRTTVTESRTVFMAMKFGDPVLNRAVDECFRPAAERAGFRLRVLTDQQPAGLIDDQLRSAILASRFVIADLTHGNQGAYWEAGYAEGLGLPVIYTCEASRWRESKTHFDTNHMVTIVWDPIDFLKSQNALTATIRATLRAEARQTD